MLPKISNLCDFVSLNKSIYILIDELKLGPFFDLPYSNKSTESNLSLTIFLKPPRDKIAELSLFAIIV